MNKLKVYCARPLSGHSYENIMAYYDSVTTRLAESGFQVFSPMTGKEALRNDREFKAHGYDTPISSNHAIKTRDQWMVRQCDIILCDLSEAKDPSIGCISEIAWGDILGKHIVVVMKEGNPNYHAFILEMAHIIFPTIDEALDYIEYFS